VTDKIYTSIRNSTHPRIDENAMATGESAVQVSVNVLSCCQPPRLSKNHYLQQGEEEISLRHNPEGTATKREVILERSEELACALPNPSPVWDLSPYLRASVSSFYQGL
jgi:hypothetical protein